MTSCTWSQVCDWTFWVSWGRNEYILLTGSKANICNQRGATDRLYHLFTSTYLLFPITILPVGSMHFPTMRTTRVTVKQNGKPCRTKPFPRQIPEEPVRLNRTQPSYSQPAALTSHKKNVCSCKRLKFGGWWLQAFSASTFLSSLYPIYCPLEFFSFSFPVPFAFPLCLECMTHIVSPHLLSIQILHHSAFSGNLCLIFQVGVTCYMPTLCFFFPLKSKHSFIFVYFCYMIIWRIFIFSTRLQAPWGEEQFLSRLYTKHLKQCLAPRMSSINSCCLDKYTWSSCTNEFKPQIL